MKNDRIIYLDYLRIFATLAVTIVHVSAQNFYHSVNTFEWNVFNVYDSIMRWAVPIFVMISGALFLKYKNDINIKNIYTKKIVRIITSFLFWSFIYTCFFVITTKNKNIIEIIKRFLIGESHMWFLFMIVGLYMIIPIMRKITESKCITEYFILLAIIFNFCVPYIFEIPKIKTLLPMYEKINMNLVLGYSGYFVLGYYLSEYDIDRKKRKYIYCLGFIGTLITILGTYILSSKSNTANTLFYSYFSFNVLIESVAIFVFAKYNFSKLVLSSNVENIIFNISKCSFGVYLSHLLVMNIFKLLGLNTLSFNSIFSVPIISIMVFVISMMISFVLNKMPKVNKYIV